MAIKNFNYQEYADQQAKIALAAGVAPDQATAQHVQNKYGVSVGYGAVRPASSAVSVSGGADIGLFGAIGAILNLGVFVFLFGGVIWLGMAHFGAKQPQSIVPKEYTSLKQTTLAPVSRPASRPSPVAPKKQIDIGRTVSPVAELNCKEVMQVLRTTKDQKVISSHVNPLFACLEAGQAHNLFSILGRKELESIRGHFEYLRH